MKPLKAQVFYNGQPVGILRRTTSEYSFRYSPDYLVSDSPAISLTLPKQAKEHKSLVLFPFFFGLLAEGVAKQIQCRELRIDEEDDMLRLVKTAHTETIGAITVREIQPA